MREQIKVNEASVVESISTRDRTLRASIPPEREQAKPDPAPEETPEQESVPAKEPEAPREESRRHRAKAEPQDYKSLFVKEVTGGKARVNKVVYIRKEHHDRILKVVQVIGKNEVSLFSFLDNVLEHHFSTFQGELSELYENSIDKSF